MITADNVMEHTCRALGFDPIDPNIGHALKHIGDEAEPGKVLKPEQIQAVTKAAQDNPHNWLGSGLNDGDLFAPTPGILV